MELLDDRITLFLNSFHNHYWDDFFYVFSGQLFWLPLAATIIYAIVKTYGKISYVPLIFVALCILFADQISSGLFKPLFERLRPSHDPDLQSLIHNVHGYKGGLYGFVSSHSANAFAFASFSILLFRNRIYTAVILTWSVLTAYSRIYLGVHFFGDVFVGGLIGVAVGVILYRIMLIVEKKSIFKIRAVGSKLMLSVLFVFVLSILVLLILAKHLLFMA